MHQTAEASEPSRSSKDRQGLLEEMQAHPPDIVIAGGGILGTGIFREAAMSGLRVALLEGMDFGWGASSCSSKMIHGGLRYLQTGRFDITYHSVHEREKLLVELPSLIAPQAFVVPAYSRWRQFIFALGLWIYDRFSRHTRHKRFRKEALFSMFPDLRKEGLCAGFSYEDALTDDVRIVLRNLHDGTEAGGRALNYVRVLETRYLGEKTEVLVEDGLGGARYTLTCRAVVNATGFAADRLREQRGLRPMMRPLRGSHLVFSKETLSVPEVLVFDHPEDRRSVYLVPWEGCTFVGTTEADDAGRTEQLTAISQEEQRYLLEAVRYIFPHKPISERDILSTWAGIRPIVSAGKKNTYKEPRDIHIHYQDGLLTVAGGKLTTFRRDAVRALHLLGPLFPSLRRLKGHSFDLPSSAVAATSEEATVSVWERTAYGAKARQFGVYRHPDDTAFATTTVTPARVRVALTEEWVEHLDDLMMRRTRLGLVLKDGGESVFPKIRELCLEAGWSAERFEAEASRYRVLVKEHYSAHLREHEG